MFPQVTNPTIEQNVTGDLIYDLSVMPSWTKIPYESGGLYDRLQKNFAQHTEDELLVNQDEYQWFRRPGASMTNHNITTKIQLLKPGVKVTDLMSIDRSAGAYRKLIETVDLVLYDSAVDIAINAATWATDKFIVKPMKIFNHDWEKVGQRSDETMYKCGTCGATGRGRFYTANYQRVKSGVCPDKLLTCDEEIVREVMV